ncbi:helix-turn-helix domain-containing protein [Puniceibacterium antarcticum]
MIVTRLAAKGITLSQIAREIDRTRGLITSVSQGHYRSRRVEEAIAAHLDCCPPDIWPDRYDDEENT